MWIVTLRDTHPRTTSITERTRWEVTVEILSREEGYGSPWRLKSQHLLDKMVEAMPEGKVKTRQYYRCMMCDPELLLLEALKSPRVIILAAPSSWPWQLQFSIFLATQSVIL